MLLFDDSFEHYVFNETAHPRLVLIVDLWHHELRTDKQRLQTVDNEEMRQDYLGVVERSFYPSIFFSGSLNPGMSGGPTLDEQGRVMGINVATRLDGQQVSFLVPAQYAIDLVARARPAKPITAPAGHESRSAGRHQGDCGGWLQ